MIGDIEPACLGIADKQMLDVGHEMEAEALPAAVARALAGAAVVAEPTLPEFDEQRRMATAVAGP